MQLYPLLNDHSSKNFLPFFFDFGRLLCFSLLPIRGQKGNQRFALVVLGPGAALNQLDQCATFLRCSGLVAFGELWVFLENLDSTGTSIWRILHSEGLKIRSYPCHVRGLAGSVSRVQGTLSSLQTAGSGTGRGKLYVLFGVVNSC